MSATPEQQAVAALIDKAIRDAGLTGAEVARLLGVHKSAVTKWRKAINAPDTATMTRLAAITGKEVSYFYGGRGTQDRRQELLELLAALGRRVASGLSVSEAFVAEGGMAYLLSEELISDLEPLGEAFRQRIGQLAGRPWERLTAQEQRLVLNRFAESLLGPPPEEHGRRGGATGDITPQSARSVH